MKKRLRFTAAMFLIPVAFFAVVEGALRVFGFGAAYPLFVPVDGRPEYLYQNRDVARRYFTHVENVPSSLADFFEAEKDSSTFRIFVQGGSSGAGFPFYYGGSFSRMLEQRLIQTFPARHIEVVNTSMAAVNSYTLADFADEILVQQPDAVLIYAGHNEYYGALGVGSSESVGGSPLLIRTYLALSDLRLTQALRRLIAWTAQAAAGRTRGEARHPYVTDGRQAVNRLRVAGIRAGAAPISKQPVASVGDVCLARRAGLHRHPREQRARSRAVRDGLYACYPAR